MIDINDKVRFEARGREIVGTVVDVKMSRPGSRKFRHFEEIHGLTLPSHRKLVVQPDRDSGEKGLWTVPEHMCKLVASGGGEQDAQSRSRELLNTIAQNQRARQYANSNTALDNGLNDLKKGDNIEVKFRDIGWTPVTFSHFAHSGTVGYERHGRVRFTAPQFVRKVTAPQP